MLTNVLIVMTLLTCIVIKLNKYKKHASKYNIFKNQKALINKLNKLKLQSYSYIIHLVTRYLKC